MTAVAADMTWSQANQLHLAAEFDRLTTLLQGQASGPLDRPDDALATFRTREALTGDAAIEKLSERFGLTSFERDVLLLASGVEMDPRIGPLCAAAAGHRGIGFATFGLAMAVLPAAHWSALTPERPLRGCRLIDVDAGRSITTEPLRIEERVLHFLAGINVLDVRLQSMIRPRSPAPLPVTTHRQTVERIIGTFRRVPGDWPILQLWGDDAEGRLDVAARAAASLGLGLHVLRSEDLPTSADDRWELATLWSREAPLLGSALLVEQARDADMRIVADFVDIVGPPVFIASREPAEFGLAAMRFEVAKPSAAERARLWHTALGPDVGGFDETLDIVVGQYRLGAGTIARLAAGIRAEVDGGTDPRVSLASACRSHATHDLDGLAQRLEPAAGWDDLVVPLDTAESLREIVAQVRNRTTVYEAWGFGLRGSRGLGITALFAGASGTGKTMAAEVLARELALDIYRIDLSTVVSKYIGETEKNLRRVFDAAEDSGAILLFDEADALFGKRGEVRDSHDRYANIEVAYLLQRMEAYRGLAILTTNIRASVDRAFQRRLRFVVDFPFPDADQRERIWRGAFPSATPVARLDYAKLARLNVAGGAIRNIGLNAAFLAARAGEAISMPHLAAAARSELAKGESARADGETRGWT